MSQGARTRVAIGSATPLKWRTSRTIKEAFGPYARLHIEPDTADEVVGRVCAVIVICSLIGLAVSAAFGGI